MLLTKEIDIVVNCVVIPHFKKLGYDFKPGQKVTIPIEHLNIGSCYKVLVMCDECGEKQEMPYKSYIKVTKYDGKYYCRKNKCFTIKVKKTTMDTYGVDNTSKLKEKQDKWKSTNIELYGFENVFQNEIVKEKIRQFYRDNYDGAEWNTQVKYIRDNNGWLDGENLEGFEKYKYKCRRKTEKNKKQLFENWDGYDYYDGEYIKDNFIFDCHDPNYPNIDHKISIKYGYENNIDIDIISGVDNLCITKLKINSSKHYMTEEEYKNKMKNDKDDKDE